MVLIRALQVGALLAVGTLSDARGQGAEADPSFVGPPRPPLYDAVRLERMLEVADELPALTSLLISRRDSLIVERYYRGMRPDQAVNVKSVSKTLLSSMVGIAILDGLLEGIEQPLSELLPDYYERLRAQGDWDPRKDDIRLRYLLTM
jgi:CubicO group peptidase (beta-lactamase class C family)